jgi:hypothetical protein
MHDWRPSVDDGEIYEFKQRVPGASLEDFIIDYANGRIPTLKDWELFQIPLPIYRFRPDIVDAIAKYGLSGFLGQQLVMEDIVSKGAPTSFIEALMQKFVGSLGSPTELVVVDPYFFSTKASRDPAYPQLVESVLSPLLGTLSKLVIVTNPRDLNAGLQSTIQSRLTTANPRLAVTVNHSDDFHDRFYLDPNARRGFMTGTSLNGLGGRYALVDHLQANDAHQLVDELRTLGLI